MLEFVGAFNRDKVDARRLEAEVAEEVTGEKVDAEDPSLFFISGSLRRLLGGTEELVALEAPALLLGMYDDDALIGAVEPIIGFLSSLTSMAPLAPILGLIS